MKIHVLSEVHGNFGDELNRWLWHALLPDAWNAQEDGVLFVGIGTILDRNLPPARLTVIFGTGAGYTPAPAGIAENSARWRIYGVRGPLTAYALKLDQRLAMTDPAILLATLPEFATPRRAGTIFVPHWKSVRYGYWQAICERIGIEFVDPCRDSKSVVRAIASAEKVIAESMHAAIIADAFRVPWIPIALSREISPFKWADWAGSMDIAYSPVCLPASTRIERARNALLKWSVHSNTARYPPVRQIEGGVRLQFEDRDQLMADFATIARHIDQKWRWNSSVAMEIVLKRLAKLGLGPSAFFEFGASDAMCDQATQHLSKLLLDDGCLSSDHAHQRSLDLTRERLHALNGDAMRGDLAA